MPHPIWECSTTSNFRGKRRGISSIDSDTLEYPRAKRKRNSQSFADIEGKQRDTKSLRTRHPIEECSRRSKQSRVQPFLVLWPSMHSFAVAKSNTALVSAVHVVPCVRHAAGAILAVVYEIWYFSAIYQFDILNSITPGYFYVACVSDVQTWPSVSSSQT